jgi:hypothetical protein
MISREAAFQDSLAQRARNKCPPKSALKARNNSARRRFNAGTILAELFDF